VRIDCCHLSIYAGSPIEKVGLSGDGFRSSLCRVRGVWGTVMTVSEDHLPFVLSRHLIRPSLFLFVFLTFDISRDLLRHVHHLSSMALS
jgi:hypothetical protein